MIYLLTNLSGTPGGCFVAESKYGNNYYAVYYFPLIYYEGSRGTLGIGGTMWEQSHSYFVYIIANNKI